MTGKLKVVRADELQMWTEKGWQLKQVLDETEVVHADEYTFKSDPRGYNNPTQERSVSKPVVLSTHRYLIELDEKSALAEQSAAYENQAAQCVAAQNRAYQSEQDLQRTQEILKEQVKEFKDQALLKAQLARELLQAQTKSQKMEVDIIGKLRKAIGELRMKEILEQP